MAIKTVKFLRALTAEDKFPKQVHDMVGAAVSGDALGKVLTHDEAVAMIAPALTTRQGPERILGYYLKAMVDAGLLEVEKAAAKPKLTDEEKAAAKATKAAAKATGKTEGAASTIADGLGEDEAGEGEGEGDEDEAAEAEEL